MMIRPAVLALFAVLALPAQNLLVNPSFENHTKGEPDGWRWEGGAAKATVAVDTDVARSGKASLRLSNPTPKAPHVFGTLTQTVPVAPNTTYSFSCHVRSADAGVAWIGGGDKWQHRVTFPRSTGGEWHRVAGRFTTGPGETSFTLRILSESPTEALWIDDVQLETGEEPTPFVYLTPLAPGEARLELTPFVPAPNLIPNPSFEEVDGVRPKGWMWDRRNTDATLAIERGDANSGEVAVRFTNGTAFGPHVYGWFGLTGGIPVQAETTYTLTAFVRSNELGRAWIGGGEGWKVRCPIPATGGQWRRISRTFTTGPGETNFALMLVTESHTEGIWLDDLSLREGVRPLPAIFDQAIPADYVDLAPQERPAVLHRGNPVNTHWAPQRWPRDAWTFSGDTFRAEGILVLALPAPGTVLTAELLAPDGTVLLAQTAPVPADARAVFLNLVGNTAHLETEEIRLRATLARDGAVLARSDRPMQLVTPARIRAKARESADRREQLADLVAQLEAKGLGAYSRVTLTVLDNFLPWIEEDIRNDLADRAWDTAHVLSGLTARETERAAAVLAGRETEFPVPRYRTGPLATDGPCTIGLHEFPDGRQERGPVFLTGYGHFGQVRRDVEKFPAYGCNFLQIEFGPRSVLPSEDTVSDRAIEDFLAVCDRAAAAHVAVNLLLSPHYFPDWALEKWPDLKDCHGGFFKYCVHDPRARSVVEKSLRHVIPRIKDHPALHSVCLSNEPICVDLRGCAVTRTAWPAWLERRHGDIATLNRRWRSQYAAFADIPVPAPDFAPTPLSVDFVRYNQETFAEFHAWMAGIVHELAPGLPVHAKIMMMAHFSRGTHGMWSVSPELFGEFSQYNGNDSCNFPSGGDWSTGWRGMEAGYDFQRSLADLPVFNSENHVIVDRYHGAVAPEHLYTALWQGAVHGQSSTTFWVWERTTDFAGDLAGSLLHRPDAVEAIGRANLDLNRLAPQIASIQRVPPEIGILWSAASVIQGDAHLPAMWRTYEAAAFQGVQLGFVTERRLEALAAGDRRRPFDSLKVLLVPQTTHLSPAAREGLAKLAESIPVVVLGEPPARDDYGNPAPPFPGTLALSLPDSAAELCQTLADRLPAWGIQPLVPATDENGQAPFGIQIRAARLDDGTRVASVCNLHREPRTLILTAAPEARDLRSGRNLPARIVLEPLQPLLLRLP